jgi:hypothetical protein
MFAAPRRVSLVPDMRKPAVVLTKDQAAAAAEALAQQHKGNSPASPPTHSVSWAIIALISGIASGYAVYLLAPGNKYLALIGVAVAATIGGSLVRRRTKRH